MTDQMLPVPGKEGDKVEEDWRVDVMNSFTQTNPEIIVKGSATDHEKQQEAKE